MKYLFAVVAAAVSAFALVGCQDRSDKELITSAQDYIAQGDAQAAIVQLKVALQRNLESGEARYLMGQALMVSGDSAGAELELGKALELKISRTKVLPLLAKAMLMNGEAKKLVELYGQTNVDSPMAMAELKTAVAAAHASQGHVEPAHEALDQALKAVPNYSAAQFVRARLLVRGKQFDQSRTLIEAVVAREPDNAEAWQLLGDVLVVSGEDTVKPMEAYRHALTLKKDELAARVGLATLLLQSHDIPQAASEIAILKSLHPGHPRVQLLVAKLAIAQNDFKTARDISQQLLKAAPENPRLLELAGYVEANAGSLLQAELFLTKALAVDAGSPVARRLLVQTHLRSGEPTKALSVLGPGLEGPNPPLDLLVLAAEAYLQLGNAKAAEATYLKASKRRPDDVSLRTGLAVSRLSLVDAEVGLRDLQTIAATDKGSTADMALISAYLGRGKLDAALLAIDKLEGKLAGQPLPSLLRGRVLLLRKDQTAARASFERAVEVDPVYFPAVANLVALDVQDGKPEQARQRLQAVLKASPGHYQALLALASLRAASGGGIDEIAGYIQAAIKTRPGEADPRVMLVNLYLSAKDSKRALSAAEEALVVLRDNEVVLDALGRAQISSGGGQQAVTVFRKLTMVLPKSPTVLLRLADAHLLLKDRASASESLKRALALQPDFLPAQRALVLLSLDDAHLPEAFAIARTVQQQRPKEPVGYLLEGDINSVHSKWDAAAEAYRQAIARAESTELAIKLHAALSGAKKPAEADSFADSWTNKHPRDVQFLIHLGDVALSNRDMPGAEKHFRAATSVNADDPQSLNNLAWVLAAQDKSGALPFAEKANKLSPTTPAMMDTLALALATDGQIKRALDTQKRAVALAPENPLLKFNLAKLYIKAGEKQLARKQLEEVADFGAKFKDQRAVQALLASL